ncbi:MAG: elongation factor Ts [Micavibrio sp.]|nr:elongation factor Ts [Micavibrio sp.]|tara:strand:- start:2620 stop:3543 length:924 start_codon:yes stop_codon:yes gene_type:complete
MAEITAALVKDLREQTGAGMMDCKKALSETDGNLEAAIDWLRKKGLSKAAKKSSRAAAEGLVAVAASADSKRASIVEINSETDFVARNEAFQGFVKNIAEKALNVKTVEELAQVDYQGKPASEALTDLIAKIGENMTMRRMTTLEVSEGVVASYIHAALVPNLGRIGVLVALESSAPADKLQDLGKQLAMHVAAANPSFLDISSVDDEALQRERAIFADQAKAAGKPADIIEKMVDGRIRKYYEEVVLMEQVFVMDGETKISTVVENAAKEAGAPIKLAGFVKFTVGEGVEKEETDFAAEVAAVANG